MARASLPDCVRCASSMKTKNSPTGAPNLTALDLGDQLPISSSSRRPNLCTREQTTRSVGSAKRPSGQHRSSCAAHLVARIAEDILDLLVQLLAVGHHQDPRIGPLPRIQRASITMIRLFPEPWVCQMIPPLGAHRSCAAFTAKYWFTRAIFLVPASNRVKSWISSRNRAGRHHLRHVPVEARGDLALLLPGQPVGLRRLDRGVAQPSLSLPAKVICTVVKKCRMNSGRWLSSVWRMPSPTPTVDFFSSTDAQGDAVDVEHQVGALVPGLGVLALDRRPPRRRRGHWRRRVAPVDEADGDGGLAGAGGDLPRRSGASRRRPGWPRRASSPSIRASRFRRVMAG